MPCIGWDHGWSSLLDVALKSVWSPSWHRRRLDVPVPGVFLDPSSRLNPTPCPANWEPQGCGIVTVCLSLWQAQEGWCPTASLEWSLATWPVLECFDHVLKKRRRGTASSNTVDNPISQSLNTTPALSEVLFLIMPRWCPDKGLPVQPLRVNQPCGRWTLRQFPLTS